MMTTLLLLHSAAGAPWSAHARINAAAPAWDVVVYGSSPAGIAAATAAGELGLRTAIFEPLAMIGGMGAAGNLALHDGGFNAISGLALNFTRLNGAYYNTTSPVQQPESFVSNASFYKMLARAGVTHVKLDCRVTAAATVETGAVGATGSKIGSMTVICEKLAVTATVFIDASYDGDLMVAAGNIPYTAGRESVAQVSPSASVGVTLTLGSSHFPPDSPRSFISPRMACRSQDTPSLMARLPVAWLRQYNESLAGARIPGTNKDRGPRAIDAMGPDGKTLIKYVQDVSTLPAPGEADDALMAFQHRLCVAGKESGYMVPWPKPKGYDPTDFLLMQRCVDAGYQGVMAGMPPGQIKDGGAMHAATGKTKYVSCCGIDVCAGDQPNLNRGWANASWDRRQEIIADHVYFEMGAYYFLAHNVTGPNSASVKHRFSSYGLCADEFQEFQNIPPQLYVRISNRMVGDYVMTQNNIATPMLKPDSIAVGDWWFDEHMTGKYGMPPNETGGAGRSGSIGSSGWTVQLEGNFDPHMPDVFGPSKTNGDFYDVPFKIMLPPRGVGGNLLVPVALSASAVAYTSTRIESMFMAVGSAAGVAAKQLVDGSVETVQDVNVTEVQTILMSRFHQQIHVTSQPASRPANYYVRGAGDATWNGKYDLAHEEDAEDVGGYPSYVLATNSSRRLYPNGLGVWRIAVKGVALAYVTSEAQASALPPLEGWSIATLGTAPPPTLVAGPGCK